MANTSKIVFNGLLIVAWLIFVGLGIEAGGLVVNFVFGLDADMLPKLYQKLNLIAMYDSSPKAFYGMYSFILAIAILKTYLFYIVVMLMHKMDLSKPFSVYVSKQITKIGYFTFSIGLLSYIAKESAENLQKKGYATDGLSQFWVDSEAFILMAAIIYIIAVIFAKGIALQNDNELTI